MEVFHDSNKVGADVVLQDCPQSCMPNPVEGLLEVYGDIVEVLPVLEIFLQRILWLKICSVVFLPALKPACSLAMIFSACGFKSVAYDLQHDFAWVADEADRSVVLALRQVAFLGKRDDEGLGPQG